MANGVVAIAFYHGWFDPDPKGEPVPMTCARRDLMMRTILHGEYVPECEYHNVDGQWYPDAPEDVVQQFYREMQEPPHLRSMSVGDIVVLYRIDEDGDWMYEELAHTFIGAWICQPIGWAAVPQFRDRVQKGA